MVKMVVEVLASLQLEIDKSDKKTQKLFYKQKDFMEMNPHYPSLVQKNMIHAKGNYKN
jgi:hypothetical protein